MEDGIELIDIKPSGPNLAKREFRDSDLNETEFRNFKNHMDAEYELLEQELANESVSNKTTLIDGFKGTINREIQRIRKDIDNCEISKAYILEKLNDSKAYYDNRTSARNDPMSQKEKVGMNDIHKTVENNVKNDCENKKEYKKRQIEYLEQLLMQTRILGLSVVGGKRRKSRGKKRSNKNRKSKKRHSRRHRK